MSRLSEYLDAKTTKAIIGAATVMSFVCITASVFHSAGKADADFKTGMSADVLNDIRAGHKQSVCVLNNGYCTYGDVFIADTNADSNVLMELNRGVDMVPDSVKSVFFANGGFVVFSGDQTFNTLSEQAGNALNASESNGFCLCNPKTGETGYIALRTYNTQGDMWGVRPPYYDVCHEFGHFLDSECGYISNSREWREICRAESKDAFYGENNTGSDYYSSSQREYFADAFASYCAYKANPYDRIGGYDMETCPETYDFIEDVVRRFEEGELGRGNAFTRNAPQTMRDLFIEPDIGH